MVVWCKTWINNLTSLMASHLPGDADGMVEIGIRNLFFKEVVKVCIFFSLHPSFRIRNLLLYNSHQIKTSNSYHQIRKSMKSIINGVSNENSFIKLLKPLFYYAVHIPSRLLTLLHTHFHMDELLARTRKCPNNRPLVLL